MADSFVADAPKDSFVPDTPKDSFVADSVKDSFTPLAGPSFIDRAKELAIKAITPIPAAQQAKEALEGKTTDILGAAQPDLLKDTGTSNPLLQALQAARNSFVPLPTPQMAKGAIEATMPTTPLDFAGTIGAEVLLPLTKMLGTSVASRAAARIGEGLDAGLKESQGIEAKTLQSVVAEKVVPLTQEEVSAHLLELKRASEGPDPLIKVIQKPTLKETALNLADRGARPRLESEKVIQGLDQVGKSFNALSEELAAKIKEGKTPLTLVEHKQFTDLLVEGLKSGDINGTVAANWMGEPAIADATGRLLKEGTPEAQVAFAKTLRTVSSQLGYGLGQLGKMKQMFESSMAPEAKTIYGKFLEGEGGIKGAWEAFNRVMRSVEAFRKSEIVSSLGLSMRDFFSHGSRYTLNAVEDVLNGTIASLTGKQPMRETFSAAFQDFASLAKVLAKTKNPELEKMMERFPLESQKLLGTPYLELSLPGKFSKFLNKIHTASFTTFNRAALDAALRNKARVLGVSVEQLGAKEFSESVRLAQTLTFSKNYTKGFVGAYLKLYREAPFLSAVWETFPRMHANLINTLYDFSPIPLMRDLTEIVASKTGTVVDSPILKKLGAPTLKRLEDVDPKVAFGAISKSIEGMGIFAAGWLLKTHGHMDEKWYEVRLGNRTIDLRRYRGVVDPMIIGSVFGGAFSAFHGEMSRSNDKQKAIDAGLAQFTKFSLSDWAQMLVSFKRTDLSGLPIADAIMSTSGKTGSKRLIDSFLSYTGQYLASFEPSMLTKTPLDILGQFNKEERLPRFIRDKPFVGPFIQNVPFLERQLPVRYSPLRSGPEERDNPGIQQATGAITRVKTPAEIEADKLGLTFKEIYPSTGNPGYDNLISKHMGPMVEGSLDNLMHREDYLLGDDEYKKEQFTNTIKMFQKASKAIAFGEISPADQLDELSKHYRGEVKKALEKQAKQLRDQVK